MKLIIKDTKLLSDIIKQPIRNRLNFHTLYSAIYEKCEITIKISSHEYKEFEELTMNKYSKYIWVIDYREIK